MDDVWPSTNVALVALSALLVAAPTADAVTVRLFANDTYVSAAGANNVQASLGGAPQAHNVIRFTDTTADGINGALTLSTAAVVIPEQENSGNLAADLGPAGRAAYRNFVLGGGTLVINGEMNGRAETFLNGVFDLGVDEQDTASAYALDTAAAAGTEFDGGPANLPDQAEVTGLTTTSLPAGTKAVYATGTHAGVAVFHYGAGSVVFLGWDWQNSDPPNPGGQDGGWRDVLHRSVDAPVVDISSQSVTEGDVGSRPMTFTMTLSHPASEEITAGFEIVAGNPAFPPPFPSIAIRGQDVILPPDGNLTFPRGVTSRSFDAHVISDTVFEENEGFEVRTDVGRNVRRVRPRLGTGFGMIVNDDPRPGRCANRRDGTNAAETIDGTNAGDLIFGLGGNDAIEGRRERDCLRGGTGHDRLDGGEHGDSLSGEAGNDRLSGGSGNDKLVGGDGNDRLNGGAGGNSYQGGAGNDRVSARNGVGGEKVSCGSGASDRATVDRTDRVSGCESVSRS